MLLMLRNNIVYDVLDEKVVNHDLLPGCLMNDSGKGMFMKWASLRRSVFDNVLSRRLLSKGFVGLSREKIDIITHSFSLSDAYWLKDYNDDYTFEELSPYFNKFWNGESKYSGGAVPTLFTNGAQSKGWVSANRLFKFGDRMKVEIECSKIFARFMPAAAVSDCDGGIWVENFTTADLMYEPFYVSKFGNLSEEFISFEKTVEFFGDEGLTMVTLDTIVANPDRHTMNYGYIRDTGTGEYLRMAPAFDWDWAKTNDTDELFGRLAALFASLSEKQKELVFSIVDGVPEITGDEVYLSRVKKLRSLLMEM